MKCSSCGEDGIIAVIAVSKVGTVVCSFAAVFLSLLLFEIEVFIIGFMTVTHVCL